MKKLLMTLLALASLFCFSCSDEDENIEIYKNEYDDNILTAKYSVGDIVLKDGTIIKYGQDVTDEQKTNAIAIIFYVGKENGKLGNRTLGVGLKKNSKALWCTSDASAAKQKVDSIICNIINDGVTTGKVEYFSEFSGDLDGSDNLTQISEYLTSKNLTDDTSDSSKYPAFYFAKNYKDTDTKLTGTSFEDGWYLPTIAELYPISKNQKKIYASFDKLGVDRISAQWADWLTSSSQNINKADYSSSIRVSDSLCNYGTKYKDENAVGVCAVRKFE